MTRTLRVIHNLFFTYICPTFYGGGAPASTNTTSTVTQNSIPAQLVPFAQTNLTAAQNQLFKTDSNGNVTGFQPYVPWSTNPQDYVAPASSVQNNAYNAAYGLSTPSQFATASQGSTTAGTGQLSTVDPSLAYGASGANYGANSAAIGTSWGLDFGGMGAQAGQDATGFGNLGAQAGQAAAGYGGMGAQAGQAATGFGNMGAAAGLSGIASGQAGLGFGSNASTIGGDAYSAASGQAGNQIGQAANYGAQGVNAGITGGLKFGSQGSAYGAQAAGQAGTGYNAGANFAAQATDPNSVAAYMSPYEQNVINQQMIQANRNYDITGTQEMGAATQNGAFGGSREAIMAAENERNRNMELSNIQANGLQNAFQNAQSQQQFGASLGVQGLNAGVNASQAGIQGAQTGIQGVNTALQGAQVGIQGVNAQTTASNMQQQGAQNALQGQSIGVSGANSAISGANSGIAGANTGISGQQAAIQGANTGITGQQAAIQGANTGISGQQAAIQGANTGLSGVNTALSGQAQGIQGANTGLAGVGAAQNAYGNLNTASSTLANIGAAQNAAQTNNINTQLTAGGQMQAQAQQGINQAVLNYQNQVNQPYLALGTMGSLIQGTPTGNITSQQYTAVPTPLTSLGTTLGAAGSLLGAATVKKKGGIIEANKYSVGGEIKSDLYNMDKAALQHIIDTTTSDTERSMAKQVLAEKSMASGGIVGFARGGDTTITGNASMADQLTEYKKSLEAKRVAAEAQRIEDAKSAYASDLSDRKTGYKPTKRMSTEAADYQASQIAADQARVVDGMVPETTPTEGGIAAGIKSPIRASLKALGALSTPQLLDDMTGQPADLETLNKYAGIRKQYGVPGVLEEMQKEFHKGNAKIGKSIDESVIQPVSNWYYGEKGQPAPTQNAPPQAPQSGIPTANKGADAQLNGDVAQAASQYLPPVSPAPKESTPEQAIEQPAPQRTEAAPEQGPTAQEQPVAQAPWSQPAMPTDAETLARIQAMQQQAGVDPERYAKERADLMAERANAEADSKRQTYLRMAEFFSHWGTTPGPPLYAGLKAMAETMPHYIEDKEKQAKLRETLHHSMSVLEQAENAEKMGNGRLAIQMKNSLAQHLQDNALVHEAVVAKSAEYEKNRKNELEKTRMLVEGKEDVEQMRQTAPGRGRSAEQISLDKINNQVLQDTKDMFPQRKGYEVGYEENKAAYKKKRKAELMAEYGISDTSKAEPALNDAPAKFTPEQIEKFKRVNPAGVN